MRLLSQCSRAHDFDWSHFRAIDKSFRANDAVQPAIIGVQRMRLRLKNVKSWSSLQKRIFANTNQNTSDSCTQKRSQDGPLRRRIKQFDFFCLAHQSRKSRIQLESGCVGVTCMTGFMRCPPKCCFDSDGNCFPEEEAGNIMSSYRYFHLCSSMLLIIPYVTSI